VDVDKLLTATRSARRAPAPRREIDEVVGINGWESAVGTDREPANHVTVSGGRYVDRLEPRRGRWAITDRVRVVEYNAESTWLITDELIAMRAAP
jgi:hypothetical protein